MEKYCINCVHCSQSPEWCCTKNTGRNLVTGSKRLGHPCHYERTEDGSCKFEGIYYEQLPPQAE